MASVVIHSQCVPIMPATDPEWSCQYLYDPLDRLASRMLAGQPGQPCFYQQSRLVTEIQGQIARSWLQTPGDLLAQQDREAGRTGCRLIACDAQGSVLQGMDTALLCRFAYTPYGYRQHEALHLPGFNRERLDPLTGHYLLGNGYRAFNPVLMRFNSPDSESPFGKGGINAYAYCADNPVSQTDPDGHFVRRPSVTGPSPEFIVPRARLTIPPDTPVWPQHPLTQIESKLERKIYNLAVKGVHLEETIQRRASTGQIQKLAVDKRLPLDQVINLENYRISDDKQKFHAEFNLRQKENSALDRLRQVYTINNSHIKEMYEAHWQFMAKRLASIRSNFPRSA